MELIEHLGGVADPAAPASASQLVALLRRELARGLEQLTGPRAGYDRPLVVPVLVSPGRLAAVVPVSARLRTDADLLDEHPRALLLVAAVIGALAQTAEHPPVLPGAPALVARYGTWEDALVIAVPWSRSTGPAVGDAELAALHVEDALDGADRLRVMPAAFPEQVAAIVLAGVEPDTAIGHRHPLDALEVLVRAGISPATAAGPGIGDDDHAYAALLDAALGRALSGHRPHEDPDPARRIARRMLQMLMGKRKWSGGTGAGYHTEVTHLTRGFDGADRELAAHVVAALVDAGLLVEKTSVGQLHVSLLSRRAAEIKALVAHGEVPADLHLPPPRGT